MDRQIYSQLLAEVAPQVIENNEEHERLLKIAEKFVFQKILSPEEKVLNKLIVFLIEDYEMKNFPMSESTPHEVLKHLMESSGISQADLMKITGSSSGVISEVVNGKRTISKAQAKALGEYFKVSPSLFI
jgi:HTH-type transcriptional regulator / antitoxin HigA